jgi:hypothetical protein
LLGLLSRPEAGSNVFLKTTGQSLIYTALQLKKLYSSEYSLSLSFFFFFYLWLYSPIWALATSMKLSVSLQLLYLGQLAGLLGQVVSSLEGLCLYTNTEECTHNTSIHTQGGIRAHDHSASKQAKTVYALDHSAIVT